MAFSIQTNVNSLVAQENLRVNSNFQSQTIQRLTSGYRINQSGDDAAGLAVANKFRSDISELTQGVRNASDGVSQLQIIDGGMNNISKMLDRLKTLATQSASDSFTGDRSALNSEYQTLVGEINRQAQSIGLNQGGSFARSLSVYLGGGTGATAAATLANGAITINLSTATVDAQSLGLQGVQAVNSATYSLASSSTTSVQTILNDRGNGAGASTPVASTQFTFFGAGYSNDASGSYSGIQIDVNLNGVGDTAGLVNAINVAIASEENQATGAAASFKAAGIEASIVTDASGNQKLAFSSSNAGFQVRADDRVSNALIGNFASDGTSVATGREMGTRVDARTGAGAIGTWDFSGSDAATFVITGANLASPKTVVYNTDASGLADLAAGAAALTTALGVTGLTVTNNAGTMRFTSTAGAFSVSVSGSSAALTALGMGASATANGTESSAGTAFSDFTADGSYLVASDGEAENFTFTAVTAGSQSVTITANDASGAAHAKTIALANGGTGATIGAAVAALNSALQQSNDTTLQRITAVQVNDAGVQKINFVSTVSSFSVTVAAASGGMSDAAGSQGTTSSADQVGSGAAADISTATGAQVAVTALTAAVRALGTAQAAIGKGQNQLSYAIGLANSQISNFSSAMAQIRDADVASEAANLTKAQVLQQAAIAAMAQANSAPQAVLALLRG
jgi:flagellin